MRLLVAADSFTVTPSGFALISMFLAAAALVGLTVTLLKGRWGWALIGLLTGGILWLGTGFIAAAPGSAWARLLRPRRRA